MTIRLAVEMPHAYLDEHGELFHYEFCLTHMAEQSEKYLNFYLKQNAAGRITILDNSVFELGKPVNTDRVLAIYNKFQNKDNVVIVAPDAFGDGPKTIQQFDEFINELSGKLPDGVKVMGVAQGKDFKEWLECYTYLVNHDAVTCVGVPYELKFDIPGYLIPAGASQTRQKMWRRIFLFQKLQDIDALGFKWHHLLGSSDPFELYYQSSITEIKTMDTSTPYVEAVMGLPALTEHTFDNSEKQKRPDDYFDKEFYESISITAKLNIMVMKLWASGRRLQ
jgi:hypothetical protein